MMLSTDASSCGFSTNWKTLQMHESSFVSKVSTQHHVANAHYLSCNAMQCSDMAVDRQLGAGREVWQGQGRIG